VGYIEIEGRFGPRRLLRAGFMMVAAAVTLWLLVVATATILPDTNANPLAKIVILTFTVVLWPVATIGVLLLLCWLILWIFQRNPNA
jgi:hypothetical protein